MFSVFIALKKLCLAYSPLITQIDLFRKGCVFEPYKVHNKDSVGSGGNRKLRNLDHA